MTNGDRGLPPVNNKTNPWIVGGLVLAAVCLFIGYDIINKRNQKEQEKVVEEFTTGVEPRQKRDVKIPEQKEDKTDLELEELKRKIEQLLAAMQDKKNKEYIARVQSPSLVYQAKERPKETPVISNASASDMALVKIDPNEGLVNPVEAKTIRDLDKVILQGRMVNGTLETAIQSDLPGQIRAIVSEDVFSFDGSRLLVPRMSRLIGHYQSGLVRGQTRVFVIWERIITPEGISVLVDSPGVDKIGRAGLSGDVDTHFFKRFGSSILLSLIDVGIQELEEDNNRSNLSIEVSEDFESAASIALRNSINIPPTVHVDQGKIINIFVNRDIDFRHALATYNIE